MILNFRTEPDSSGELPSETSLSLAVVPMHAQQTHQHAHVLKDALSVSSIFFPLAQIKDPLVSSILR